jgi:hypothetical protein
VDEPRTSRFLPRWARGDDNPRAILCDLPDIGFVADPPPSPAMTNREPVSDDSVGSMVRRTYRPAATTDVGL